jgi:hypothetical protein
MLLHATRSALLHIILPVLYTIPTDIPDAVTCNPLSPVAYHSPSTVHNIYRYTRWCYMQPAQPCCVSFSQCCTQYIQIYQMVLHVTRSALLHIISPLLYTLLQLYRMVLTCNPLGPAAHNFLSAVLCV